MKNFKRISLLLTFILVIGLLSGCGNGNANEVNEAVNVNEMANENDEVADNDNEALLDMQSRAPHFEEVPERVVALQPSDAEILFAIDAGDTLVGRGTYVDYPEEALDAPVVASGSDLNIEEIIALEPDVVFMTDMDQTEEQVNMLEEAGVPVVITSATNIEDVYSVIHLMGEVMDKTEEADRVVNDMKTTFDKLAESAEANEGKKVYFEVSPLEHGLWSAGQDTFMNEIAEMLGLTNIFEDLSGWAEVSEEQVIERDPDYIVTITMGELGNETPVEEILGRDGWEDISAVKNEKVLNLVDDELSRPSPRLVEGAQALEEFVNE